MRITFPHIGDTHLIARLFFSEIGVDLVSPPVNSDRVLENGSDLSPEEICIPFKLMLENLIEAYQLGADTVLMPATMGPCRLGEYGELLKSILDRRGYTYRWILLDSIRAIGRKEMLHRLSAVIADSAMSKGRILHALYCAYRTLRELELLDQRTSMMCGYEAHRGAFKAVKINCRRELSEVQSFRAAHKIIRNHIMNISKIELDNTKQPLRIVLTGEIFTMIEPYANHHIEETLMDFGVSFEKKVTLGWWVRRTILDPAGFRSLRTKKNRYLPLAVGGYAKETVQEGLRSMSGGYDGVIQMFPVGCMPEIVAKSALSRMMKKEHIHVLTLIYDEMGGEAGYLTRIEAFIDLLERKKNKERAHAISGN